MIDIRDHGGAYGGKSGNPIPKTAYIGAISPVLYTTSYERHIIAGNYHYTRQDNTGWSVSDLANNVKYKDYTSPPANDTPYLKADSYDDDIYTSAKVGGYVARINKDFEIVWQNLGVAWSHRGSCLTKDFVYMIYNGNLYKLNRQTGETIASVAFATRSFQKLFATYDGTTLINFYLDGSGLHFDIIDATNLSVIKSFNNNTLNTVNGDIPIGADIRDDILVALYRKSSNSTTYMTMFDISITVPEIITKEIVMPYMSTYAYDYSETAVNYKEGMAVQSKFPYLLTYTRESYNQANFMASNAYSGRMTNKRFSCVSLYGGTHLEHGLIKY